MKPIRVILGLACIVVAAVPPYILYAKSEDGNLLNPSLFLGTLAASVTSFTVFSFCKLIPSYRGQLIGGVLGSYFALLGLVFLVAAVHGDFAETTMWTPVIVLFGVPFMAPLVGLSWVSSTLVFGFRR